MQSKGRKRENKYITRDAPWRNNGCKKKRKEKEECNEVYEEERSWKIIKQDIAVISRRVWSGCAASLCLPSIKPPKCICASVWMLHVRLRLPICLYACLGRMHMHAYAFCERDIWMNKRLATICYLVSRTKLSVCFVYSVTFHIFFKKHRTFTRKFDF